MALLLLVLAGLRHHLVWGRFPTFTLRPWLDALETGCLLGFAWFGTRGWLAAMAAVRERTPGMRALVRATVPLFGLAILVPTFLSADVADYVMRGRILSLHDSNPYVHMAAEFADDPFLAFGDTSWKRFPLPYGPVVADLQGAIAWLAHQASFLAPRGQLVLAVALFKLVFAACLMASALLARSIYAQLRTGDGDVAFVSVAWCPLVLNEAVASAHNESLLLLTILMAVWAAMRHRLALCACALALGTLTKIIPLLLSPLFFVYAWRSRRLTPFLLGTAAAAAIACFYWLRFFTEPGSLDFLRRQSQVTLGSLVWAVSKLLAMDPAPFLLAGRLLVVTVILLVTVRLWRKPTPEHLVHGSAVVLATMACCGLAAFGAWYHVWWLPLALLANGPRLHRFALAAVWLAPLGYVLWTGLRTLDERHQAAQLTMSIVVPGLIAFARPPRPAPAGLAPTGISS